MEISGLLVGIFLTVAVMVFGIVLYAKLFTSGIIGVEEYHLHSRFEKAFGLNPGTLVQISGVEVGKIGEMKVEGDGVKIDFIIRKEFQNLITDSATVFAMRDQNRHPPWKGTRIRGWRLPAAWTNTGYRNRIGKD